MKRWLLTAALAATVTPAPARADHHAIGTPATVTVTVPPGATLTINGQRTAQMTAVRHFVSPPLEPGRTYAYTFQATYTQAGKPVAKVHQVQLSAGGSAALDMATGTDVAVATPTTPGVEPDPLPNRFDVPPRTEPKPAPRPDEPKKVVPKAEEPKKPEPPAPDKKPEATAEPPAKKADVKKPEIEVPYVPTPEKVVTEMLKMAAVKEGDVVYDLGCGDGRIVIAAVKEFKAKKGLGIDFNPERVDDSKKAAQKAGADVEKKLEFKQGDVLKLTEKDFEGVDVVTLYLLPEVNLKLKPILQKGLKPGARVVSHDFDMGDDWKPEKTATVMDDDGVSHSVYLWTIKGENKK